MNNAVASLEFHWEQPAPVSLDSSGDDEWPECSRYCPAKLLDKFALLMAGHARPVNTSMMLGDREYAMWQLARAHTLGDRQLREVSAKLFTYFHDHAAPVPVGLRA